MFTLWTLLNLWQLGFIWSGYLTTSDECEPHLVKDSLKTLFPEKVEDSIVYILT